MRQRDETYRRLQAEIAGEKAASLGRAGERLEAALGEVAAAAMRLHAAVDNQKRMVLAEAYQQARGTMPSRRA